MSESPQGSSPLNYATPGAYSGPAPTKDEQNMALLIFLLCILTGFIGPLIIWLIKKDGSQFLNDQGKECLNWCITFVIAYVICILLMFVVIGIFLIPVVLLVHLIFNIMGIIASTKGKAYRYPFALRLLK